MNLNNDIHFEQLNALGVITLTRQKVLNALNHAMFNTLNQILHDCVKTPTIKAVLIRAAAGRAFSAGGDIRSVYERKAAGDVHYVQLFEDEYALNRFIYHYPKPYIALLDGITMGGGAGVSIHGSHRIGTENLVFAMPETAIGFFPDIGASYFLSRLPHQFGMYLGLTGNSIDYKDCYALKIVDAIISAESQNAFIDALRSSALTHEAIHEIIKTWACEVPAASLWAHKNEVESCFSKRSVEDIIAALEALGNEWGNKTAHTLKTKSPTSLKVTLRELQRGEKLDFDACMKMELHLMHHFLNSHDFFEGIRAQVIDKDRKPRWQPATLAEINEEMLNEYFAMASAQKF